MIKYSALLLLMFLLSSCFNAPFAETINPKTDKIFLNGKYGNKAGITDFTPVGKQYYFIKVWGFLKYHANFDNAEINWDNYFIENIDQVSDMNRQEYIAFIGKTLNLFPKPQAKKQKNNIKNYCLIDNAWFNNGVYFNEDISNTLNYYFENYAIPEQKFLDQTRIGNLEFTNENSYDETSLPDKNTRLLGLARYWNIINYFYVYKNDMDENWDIVLTTFIPKFSTADNEHTYHLLTQELSSKLYDCHSMVYSQLMDSKIYGRNVPNFRVKLLDSTVIVKSLRVPSWSDGKIKVGDIIVSIDGEDALKKYRHLNKLFKGANPLSEQRTICPHLVSSVKNTMALVVNRNGSNITVPLSLKDYSEFSDEENKIKEEFQEKIVLQKYPGSVAYINLDYISDSNFDDNFKAARNYKNLIIDSRNYPHGNTSLNLSRFVIPKKAAFFKSTYADISNPGMLRIKKGYELGSNDNEHYKGNIYVLVNEATQSQAEFLVMALQTNNKVKTIGGQTAGSDGNIQEFHFPGKIKTVFTGLGIYYPNNTPTQRRGIKVDIPVNQTLTEIAAGRDEILEKALAIIKSK